MLNRLELLNSFQRLVIEFANKEGIILQNEFKSVDAFKEFVIGLLFRMLTDMGVETDTAFDLVFGDGAYNRLAESVWNSARERQGIAQ